MIAVIALFNSAAIGFFGIEPVATSAVGQGRYRVRMHGKVDLDARGRLVRINFIKCLWKMGNLNLYSTFRVRFERLELPLRECYFETYMSSVADYISELKEALVDCGEDRKEVLRAVELVSSGIMPEDAPTPIDHTTETEEGIRFVEEYIKQQTEPEAEKKAERARLMRVDFIRLHWRKPSLHKHSRLVVKFPAVEPEVRDAYIRRFNATIPEYTAELQLALLEAGERPEEVSKLIAELVKRLARQAAEQRVTDAAPKPEKPPLASAPQQVKAERRRQIENRAVIAGFSAYFGGGMLLNYVINYVWYVSDSWWEAIMGSWGLVGLGVLVWVKTQVQYFYWNRDRTRE